MKTIATGDIAGFLSRPGKDASEASERIKHWTRLKLLRPVKNFGGGTGRHFRYDETVVLDAAILWALADAGISLQKLSGRMQYAFGRARWAYDQWTANGERGAFPLVFSSIPTQHWAPELVEVYEDLASVEPQPGTAVYMVVILSEIFKRLPRRALFDEATHQSTKPKRKTVRPPPSRRER